MALVRITSTVGGWPLHEAADSRRAEQAALAHSAAHALIEAAGLAVAKLAMAVAPHAGRVQVWAGPGNNGGDGLIAARHLHQAGRDVTVTLVGDAARLPVDAAHALRTAQAAGVCLSTAVPTAPSDLVIDALLGLGARRPPEGALRDAIVHINHCGAQVLAVDVPSGLNCDSGSLLGDVAVRAHDTLCLLTLKAGCFTAAGRDHAGGVWLDGLDVDAGAPTAWLVGEAPLPRRHHATHKGSYGDVAVVGGAPGMTGAAWLAARAALAAGAGRVYCSLLDGAAPLLDPPHPELMGRRAWWTAPPAVLAATTVACGCGGGDGLHEVLPRLLSHVDRLVLDADALNALANDSGLQTLLRQRAARGLATVLTPHPLEAARLLQTDSAGVQQDRVAAATALAGKFGCCVVLKGSGSVIAAPSELPRINPTGNAALASPGTGDVLAGWTAGLWAQARELAPIEIASRAAWQHGRAADLWVAAGGSAALRASLLVDELAALRAG